MIESYDPNGQLSLSFPTKDSEEVFPASGNLWHLLLEDFWSEKVCKLPIHIER